MIRNSNIPEELTFQISAEDDRKQGEELILTPSTAEERRESTKLTLEAEKIIKAEEIAFDGMAEAEARIEDAMKAYSAAMDEAAE